jgi:hypothetical protein
VALYYERLAIILGIITLVSALFVFFSCRIFVSRLPSPGSKPSRLKKLYKSFYKYHLYYWWALGVALLAHLMLAVLHTGLPQSGDPDAGIHWAILGFGVAGSISALVLFSSCRIVPRLLAMAGTADPFQSHVFKSAYKYHTYYWAILGMVVLTHFGIALAHAGIWPGTP